MKYLDTMVTFSEFPDEITLCINITNCPFHCPGCHSPELWKDVGKPLTQRSLERLISENNGITCVGFMGGDPEIVNLLAQIVHKHYLSVGWYWGGEKFPTEIDLANFEYIKIGPYIKELGPLDNPKTNQRMYEIVEMEDEYGARFYQPQDITYKFWKHGEK